MYEIDISAAEHFEEVRKFIESFFNYERKRILRYLFKVSQSCSIKNGILVETLFRVPN